MSGRLCASACSQTSRGKLLDSAHLSRKVERKPCTVSWCAKFDGRTDELRNPRIPSCRNDQPRPARFAYFANFEGMAHHLRMDTCIKPVGDSALETAKRERQAASRALVAQGKRTQDSMFLISIKGAKAAKVRHRALSFG